MTNLGFPTLRLAADKLRSNEPSSGIGSRQSWFCRVRLTRLGLPAIGFAAYKVNNGAMSYGNASEHKTSTVTRLLSVLMSLKTVEAKKKGPVRALLIGNSAVNPLRCYLKGICLAHLCLIYEVQTTGG